MTDMRLSIDGEEVTLVPDGKSRKGTYEKWREPDEYHGKGTGESPLIVTIYRRPGWTPSQGNGEYDQ